MSESKLLVELQYLPKTVCRTDVLSPGFWHAPVIIDVTVGSFAAVVYFTSCGYIPVVVVSGTGELLSVMRAYWIMPPLDSQRSFVANRHLDKTG